MRKGRYSGEKIIRVLEQVVVLPDGRQVVSPGIAVTLREEHHGVPFVDHPIGLVGDPISVLVGVLVGDVVALRVGHLAVALGEVPDQPVVEGAHAAVGRRRRQRLPGHQGGNRSG